MAKQLKLPSICDKCGFTAKNNQGLAMHQYQKHLVQPEIQRKAIELKGSGYSEAVDKLSAGLLQLNERITGLEKSSVVELSESDKSELVSAVVGEAKSVFESHQMEGATRIVEILDKAIQAHDTNLTKSVLDLAFNAFESRARELVNSLLAEAVASIQPSGEHQIPSLAMVLAHCQECESHRAQLNEFITNLHEQWKREQDAIDGAVHDHLKPKTEEHPPLKVQFVSKKDRHGEHPPLKVQIG